MRTDVATVIPETSLAEVARLVRDTGRPVAVLAGGRWLVGVVGAGELLAMRERAPAVEG
jgi:CBS domain-containing protein